MRRLTTAAGFVLILAMVAMPARAKGATEAAIAGPGLDEPMIVSNHDGALQELLELAGFWEMLYGAEPSGPTVSHVHAMPSGDLGPMYTITWLLPEGPYPATTELYPSAPGGPLIHVVAGPGGRYGIDAVPGGWLRSDARLVDLLAEYGVPVDGSVSPQSSETVSVGVTSLGISVFTALALMLLWYSSRGRRRDPATS